MFAEPVLGRAVMGERSHEGTICAAPPRHVPEMQSCVIGCRKITSLAVRSDALCVLVSFCERIEQWGQAVVDNVTPAQLLSMLEHPCFYIQEQKLPFFRTRIRANAR